MAGTKRTTVTKRLKGHFTKGSKTAAVDRNKTIRRRILGAISQALLEVERLDTLSREGIVPHTGKHA